VPDPDLREVIFQMVRELLLNVAQHAGVDEAYLRLRRVGDRLVVRVADEGSGFDPTLLDSGEDAAFGLRTLRERVDIFGGAVEVDSQPGQGTRITLVMPTAL
jgi:two-component system NarL family sensor kinase